MSGPGDCTPGTWTPQSVLAFAVDAAGFLYDPRQDIIYSKMYPLQRHFGYAYGYDAAALAMNAIIDCEPIFFDYAGQDMDDRALEGPVRPRDGLRDRCL